jgi:hypothetical protein
MGAYVKMSRKGEFYLNESLPARISKLPSLRFSLPNPIVSVMSATGNSLVPHSGLEAFVAYNHWNHM